MSNLQYRIWSKKYKMFTTDPRWPNNQITHESYLIDQNGKVVEIVDLGENSAIYNPTNKRDWIVQRYTGIKDSEGKKIFEGDILFHLTENRNIEIKFNDGAFCFYGIESPHPEEGYVLTDSYRKEVRIIGNVLQNKSWVI